MTIQANQGLGVSVFGATSAGGGGGGTPGGSSGQVQYNNGGAFGGMAGTSWDDTNRALTLTGATVTTSQPVLNLSQTWNAGAVTFTGLKFNATDTASAAGSLLLDLQVGAVSQFNLNKSGVAAFAAGTAAAPTIGFGDTQTGFYRQAANRIGVSIQGTLVTLWTQAVIRLPNTQSIGWSSGSPSATTEDTLLGRAAAATLQLGAADAAAPIAQTLQVQSVVAGTSNTAGANFTINGSKGTGTGAGGSITLQTFLAGTTGTSQNTTAVGMSIAPLGTSSVLVGFNSTSLPMYFRATPNFLGVTDTTTKSNVGFYGNGNLSFQQLASIQWTNNANNADTTATLILSQDAAGILALRNGANNGVIRIYNTGDTTNFQRMNLSCGLTANMGVISVGNGGTGLACGLQFAVSLGTGTGPTNISYFDTTGHLLWNTDNTYDIGASGATRPRAGYFANAVVAVNGFFAGSLSSAAKWGSSGNGIAIISNANVDDFNRLQFGGTTSSFPALKRSSATLQVRLADDSAYAPVEASTVRTATAYTVATLPAAGTAGRRAYVTDATAPTFLGALTGGGAVVCPVFDNGTAWVAG